MENLFPAIQTPDQFPLVAVFAVKKPICEKSPRWSSKEIRKKSQTKKMPFLTTPKLTSKHWCIFEMHTEQVFCSQNDLEAVEIASLTKIMTCILGLDLVRKFGIPWDSYVLVSEFAASARGTSAKLRKGDKIRLNDLFYALMLPSGNDAALVLAEFLGSYVSQQSHNPVGHFVVEMNQLAKDSRLISTFYNNPHGLVNKRNVSTARDVCKLAGIGLKDPKFGQIVNTQFYTAHILRGKLNAPKELNWKNTNKLLEEGFIGVKTGITTKAGPCLCVAKRVAGYSVLVVTILQCKSEDLRWGEVTMLINWASKKYQNRTYN